jgi:hypothetical protein
MSPKSLDGGKGRQRRCLVDGDYYQGAYGPSIILILTSPQAVRWLDDVFLRLEQSSVPFELSADPAVNITNVATLSLVPRPDGEESELRLVGAGVPASFVWYLTPSGCREVRMLIEPFLADKHGHQYLTREYVDDALVELSYGEHHIRPAQRS